MRRKRIPKKLKLDTAQVRTLGISTFASPTSFKASILQFCVML
ncbi:hypothetical protein HMPREF9554_01208 [Treponema phagedenis F0421]|nr:hypothetical protein HMPREF9554_01208 [Treponema phagedenis F0421]